MPSLVKASLWQMPQAWTLTRTWPAVGSGMPRSASSNGPFGSVTWTTRILVIVALPLLWPCAKAHAMSTQAGSLQFVTFGMVSIPKAAVQRGMSDGQAPLLRPKA